MFLITGAKGQLGLCFKDLLAEKALYTDVDTLDITDKEDLFKWAENKNIKAIINCAAYTNVEKAEQEQSLAQKINVVGVENLAKLAAELNALIVHFSTDYVFDGSDTAPICEETKPSPLNFYGKTKFEGEEKILKYAKTAVIIRTAWLYSPYGKNFVKTMLNLGETKKEINVVSDQIGTPTFAPHLVKAVLDIMPKVKQNSREIYHYTDDGVASWYDLASFVIKTAALPAKVNPILTKDYPTQARRPMYSVLSKEKIIKTFNITLNPWQRGVEKCLKQLS